MVIEATTVSRLCLILCPVFIVGHSTILSIQVKNIIAYYRNLALIEVMKPKRSPGKTAISVSLEKELLDKIDERSKNLGITRSAYLCNLARNDLAKGGEFVIGKKTAKEGHDPFGSHNRVKKDKYE